MFKAAIWALLHQKIYAAIHLDLRSGKVANLPAFLRHFTEARPLLVVVSRSFQSRASRAVQLAKKMAAPIVNGGWVVFSFYLYHVSRRFQSRASRAVQLAKKMAAPIVNGGWDVFSLYLYHVGGFNVVFKSSYTFDFIAALIRSPIYALHGLALRAIQCKVVFSNWFSKETMLLMMTSLLLLPLVARQKHKWQTGRLEQGKYVMFSLKLVVRNCVPSKWIAALALTLALTLEFSLAMVALT
jgi:hypothetical protein